MAANDLAVLGVSALEEECYRYFLRRPGARAGDLEGVLDARPTEIHDGVAKLSELGLLHLAGPGGPVSPAEPESALARLVDRRLGQLHEEVGRVTRSRHLLDGLRADAVTCAETPPGVEQLEHADDIHDRIDDLAFFARDEVLAVADSLHPSLDGIVRSRRRDLRCLRRGVRVRSVVAHRALEHPPTRDYLRELAAHGGEIRVVAGDTAERMAVYDRSTAVVPVDPRDPSRGAVFARRIGLVTHLVALFERIWETGETFEAAVSPGGGSDSGPEPGERELLVLARMCNGTKDEAAARELGVSVRTYRRYVADVLRLLDAGCRAQAALRARERGWI
ncbi:helix-turn-helix transcriptional regulator [Streptomyces sp. NPDC005805]|uniref:helix-turn-helix transcriptional regulator n=1 Tax=Streptomyces sp. NPDC005805 TaxID=3157068 RepID=UPI0033F5AB5D